MVTIDNELQFEYKRLETFKNGEWPYCEIDPAPLAKEGFCYTGKSDCCVCAFCRGTVRCWRSKPDAEMEHSRLFPLCKYVLDKNVGNVPLMSSTFSLTKVIRSNNTEPVHVNFVMHRQRMESFMNWPRDKKIPKAVDLAEAGFLRPAKTLVTRPGSMLQCGISLEKWTEDDIPWNQHALWNPYCSYLRMVKGEEFIMEVHNMNYTRMSTISDSTLNQ
nr:baculoviral IAP repeat-containing protein 3-like [Penaeus vannamei]